MWRHTLVAIGCAALAGACAAGDAVESGTAAGEATAGEAAAAPAAAPAFTPTVATEADLPADVHRDSLARLPLPVREQMDADGQRAWDIVRAPGSRYEDSLWGPVAMWLYSPGMLEHLFPASTYLRFGTDKDQRLTELAILATAREVRSQYEWTAHEPPAVEAGLEAEIIEIVRDRLPLGEPGDVPGLGDVERLIIEFAREVVSEERVSPETFARARELLGDRGVMDLTGLIGYYSFVNITLKSFDLQVAPGRERLLPDLW